MNSREAVLAVKSDGKTGVFFFFRKPILCSFNLVWGETIEGVFFVFYPFRGVQ